VTSFYLINYVKHCISNTAVHTNDTEFTQQVGVGNNYFWLHTMKCARWCVLVFVFQQINTEILC